MRFVQAQFSLKYEPQLKIRRSANQIEDLLQEYYGAPQVIPIPDEIAAEAPRIVLNSHNGHSQINFSQIAVDFTARFDGDFFNNYENTKKYILNRVQLLKKALREIGINEYYFFGVTYNIHLDIGDDEPLEHIKVLLGGNLNNKENLYEVMQRTALLEDNKFFINQQISTFKEYQSNGMNIPDLIDFSNSKLMAEGVSVSLDVNNRYSFLKSGMNTSMDAFDADFIRMFELIEQNIEPFK